MLNYSLLYLEQLTESDLVLISGAVGEAKERIRSELGSDRAALDQWLGSSELFDSIFEPNSGDLGPFPSPFLLFGVMVGRAAMELSSTVQISEWSGPGRRIPVFDASNLSDFLQSGFRRFFLVEVLASFTKVASGSFWVRTDRGYRRRRFSELDPVQMLGMVEQLPEAQRAAGYRRLGDVALFLSGVFPDHTSRHPYRPMERDRLARSASIPPGSALIDDAVTFLELAGSGWYRRSEAAAERYAGARWGFLGDMAEHFRQARRVLNYLADQYLFRRETGLMRPAG
ncbi:MAG: hypothetical protein WBZ45_06360 [Acidimicrobiia bacterium]